MRTILCIQNSKKNLSGEYFDAPKYVWGIVDPRETGGRENPPGIKIFPTKDSFFDKGHVMALELGGADDQENLVPQFRETNQHLAWKKMESALRESAKQTWKKT